MLRNMVGAKAMAVNKEDKISCPHGASILATQYQRM